jgi:hypothetical protein
LGRDFGRELVYLLGQARPIPNGDMMSIQKLQQTAAAILVPRDIPAQRAAAAAELRSAAMTALST